MTTANGDPGREALCEMHAVMARIKACDDQLRTAIGRGRLPMFHFSVRGQEAIPAGISQAVAPTDFLVSTYRGMHDAIGKGASMSKLLGEMMAKGTGFAGGKGGPMHISDRESGVILTSGVVGSALPIANGLAWASQLRDDGRVTICSFGDGATNTGAFHEAMNLAAVWDLPVVFVCQNNLYSETTRTEEMYRCPTLAERGAAYGMPGLTVDGFDPLAVYRALSQAVERARSGSGPTFVDCVCYRFFGHYFGDPMDNVPAAELEAERAKDPVPRFARWLVDSGTCTEAEVKGIEALAEEAAAEAFEAAMAAPAPDARTAYDGAYAAPTATR